MSHFNQGALNFITNVYTLPNNALKTQKYICPDCNEFVVVKQGNIKIHHFSHKANCECSYFSHPSESQIHKDVKLKIKNFLENGGEIQFWRGCENCQCKIDDVDNPIKINDNQIIKLEYCFEYNNKKKIADIDCIENDKIVWIIEVMNTRKTKEEDRPEPWYEVDVNYVFGDRYITITKIWERCLRQPYNTKCWRCEKKKR